MKLTSSLLQQFLLCAPGALGALSVDVENPDSVKAAATQVAADLMSYYHGNEPGAIPGLLSDEPPQGDYYWWTGGAFWGTLLDLRSRTANTTYDDVITQGLQWQIGPANNFMPPNYTASMGNDDQAFWGLAASLAKETGFKDPASGQPQWLTLAQNVFDDQTARRISDGGSCPGVLRWQIVSFATGYDYVSTASNALYFSLGAQLAYITKNQTYTDLANKTYDSLQSLGFIASDFSVYDGASVAENCTDVDKLQFSYDAAALLQGSAFLYNLTGNDVWKSRINGLLNRTLEVFFPSGIATEIACEPDRCTIDMQFFKGFLHRWLGSTMRLAPFTANTILPVLKKSTAAAVAQCSGGTNGRMCGTTWTSGFDNKTNAGGQSSVLGALISIMDDKGTNTSSSTGNNTGNSGGTAGGATNSTGSGTPGSKGASVEISVFLLVGGLLLSVI